MTWRKPSCTDRQPDVCEGDGGGGVQGVQAQLPRVCARRQHVRQRLQQRAASSHASAGSDGILVWDVQATARMPHVERKCGAPG